jgi:hypothetical protein
MMIMMMISPSLFYIKILYANVQETEIFITTAVRSSNFTRAPKVLVF